MQIHGGRVVARALKREGVPYVFTLCGGHVMSIYDGCLDEGIGVIDVRHEQSAAHAADGWARVTGRPGVAIVTAGPGLTDAVTGVATAWRANIPMLVIGGQAPRFFQDMGGLQDMAHVDLMKPITKWAVSVPHARRLGEYVASAVRVATTNVPGPVFLEMPLDLLFDNVEDSEVVVPEQSRTEAGIAPDPRYVERAFELLRGAQRPVCLVGSQLFWSRRREAYPEFVRTFAMPIYVNGQARGSLDPEDPHWFLHTRKDALKRADVVLIFGTPLDFRLGYGRSSHINEAARLIHVDLDGRELGKNRGCDVGIIGDTGLVMEALTACARAARWAPELSRGWLGELRALERKKWEALAPQRRHHHVRRRRLRPQHDGVRGLRPAEDQHRGRDRQRRGVDPDPARPGADVRPRPHARVSARPQSLRSHDRGARRARRVGRAAGADPPRARAGARRRQAGARQRPHRSEGHPSELQSRADLV